MLSEQFTDSNVTIKQDGDYLLCLWVSENELNKSYMESKLAEYIGNKFSGAWLVSNTIEAKTSRGLRCFIMDWNNNELRARWI